MTKTKPEYAAEFAGRYKAFTSVSGLVAKLGDKTKPEWADARKDIILMQPFTHDSLREAAVLEADDVTVAGYAKTTLGQAKEIVEGYFTGNIQNIAEDLQVKGLLEKIGPIFEPVKLKDDNPAAAKHNPAVALFESYKKMEKANKSYDEQEVQPEVYRDVISKEIKGDVEAIYATEGASEKAKKAFAGLTIELAKKSSRFARAAGQLIAARKVQAFARYFEEQPEQNPYTPVDFARNNFIYGNPSKTMKALGDALTVEEKKK